MLLELFAWLALAQETRTETWPDGKPRAVYEVELGVDGEAVKHGPWRAFHPDGTLAEEGAFEHGKATGPWVLYHANGARSAEGRFADGMKSGRWHTFHPDGKSLSEGSYVRGAQSGRWTFWRADGTKDLGASGLYRLEVRRDKACERHYRGYFVDNVRQGRWTTTWPDGTPQLTGDFTGGARSGEWIFQHPDGAPSALLLSGVYAEGHWIAPPPPQEAPPLDRARWPAPASAPDGLPAQHSELAAALEAALAARTLSPELTTALEGLGPPALPVALLLWQAQDPETPAGRAALGFLEDRVLRALCSGHVLSEHGTDGPPDASAARELWRAWLSAWRVARCDASFWASLREVAPARGVRGPLHDPPLLERDTLPAPGGDAPAPAEPGAPGGDAAAPGSATPPRDPYRLRTGKEKERMLRAAPSGTEECVERALAWLAAHQEADGHWSNAGFGARCGSLGKEPCDGPGMAVYDVGATALALLAFLGDGRSSVAGKSQELVARGLAWLVSQQNAEGLIGAREQHDFLYGHALATTALCEAVGLGAADLRPAAERAVALLQLGRHADAGWRYDVPATERGDVSVTGWALGALVAARDAGIAIDEAALAGGLALVEELTEPRTGRVGYNTRGEMSSRTTENDGFPRELGEAMTAIGLFWRLRLGQRPDDTPLLVQHARLVAARPPHSHPDFGGDHYHWFHGTLALHELGAPYWNAWKEELETGVIAAQDRTGDARGSWDPSGPWGAAMGRVTTTALLTLALECVYRTPRALEERVRRR